LKESNPGCRNEEMKEGEAKMAKYRKINEAASAYLAEAKE
jgi:hypothetical protein